MAAITQPSSNLGSNRSILSAQFREIHKNTWLKRLNADGKKITVGPKKSERSWVVFCVHDDTEAILEGYAEPRQAASHSPEWAVSMQNTLHISHALIPNSNEFEFVVTLSNEVIRFHAMSWEIMQEWVETLRSKLREMKILSPRENLYTKMPEIRPPLLPTRDPTSPLPLPPPVPAAIVPGVEIIVPPSIQQQPAITTTSQSNQGEVVSRAAANTTITAATTTAATTINDTATSLTAATVSNTPVMSNTSTQNLLNMLLDPISSYSEQLQGAIANTNTSSCNARHNIEQLSTSLNDLRLNQSTLDEDEDCLSPLLRPGTSLNNAESKKRNSADQPRNVVMQCDRLIPRPHTSRSQSAGAADKNKSGKQIVNKSLISNVTALEITNSSSNMSQTTEETINNVEEENPKSNITIIQVSSNDDDSLQTNTTELNNSAVPSLPAKSSTLIAAEVFKFPEMNKNDVTTINTTHTKTASNMIPTKQHSDYKSNVQLIPSNGSTSSSTIKILGETPTSSSNLVNLTTSNQYSTPIKKKIQQENNSTKSATKVESNQITTVHVGGNATVYGTCFHGSTLSQERETSSHSSPLLTPKLPKKIILSANTSGITNITVDSHHMNRDRSQGQSQDNSIRCNVGNVHYEKVFLSSSIPIAATEANATTSLVATNSSATSKNISATSTAIIMNDLAAPKRNELKVDSASKGVIPHANIDHISMATSTPTPTSTITSPQTDNQSTNKAVKTSQTTAHTGEICNKPLPLIRSPLVQRRAAAVAPSSSRSTNMLTRGLTEAVITTRPSRRDLFANSSSNTPNTNNTSMHSVVKPTSSTSNKSTVNNNENGETSISSTDVLDQRRRSSSTSDATITTRAQQQRPTRGSNNNELLLLMSNSRCPNKALRFQQPPQPHFRNAVENGIPLGPRLIGGAAGMSPPPVSAVSASKRLTLREQQVMQLRREIMHPGGVRLQLRRKDCISSIAWIDAFGAVWVAGWKQKEHPVLYNALHIGDQLLSIAGVSISSAAEANKTIRNTNTLFVELLIRRMPFGCGIAIRRDREGQCLGLIRDGNTATIVDVVPNSLAARHGLPPKTQACDGASLTFWVLTEINGRPLNLFFKDNEIRDRLNSVGRDISILVQPSDLVTKLKKQLKSLRGYKDYLVQ